MTNDGAYGCADYREEMILLGLKRRLEEETLSEKEKQTILSRIDALEKSLGMQ